MHTTKKFTLTHLFFILIILAAAYLRLKDLTFQSYWHDELLEAWNSAPEYNLKEVIGLTSIYNPQPYLSYIVLWGWYKVFGYTEFSGRLLAALVGVLGVAAVYSLGKELANRRAGLVASLITGLNIFHLYHSQEVRNYALFFLLATLSYLYFARTLRTRSLKDLLLYITCTELALYTHYFGVILFGSQAAYTLLYLLFDSRFTAAGTPAYRRFTGHYWQRMVKLGLAAGVTIVLLYLPMINRLHYLSQWEKKARTVPRPDFFVQYFREYIANPYLIYLFTALLLFTFFLLVTSNDHKRKRAIALLYSWVFISYAGAYIGLNVAVTSTHMKERYTIFVLPAFVLLFAIGLDAIRERTFKAMLIISIVVMSLTHIFIDVGYYSTVTKQQWREVTQELIDRDDLWPLYGVKNSSVRLYEVYFRLLGSNRSITRVTKLEGDLHGLSCFWLLDAHWYLFTETEDMDQYPIIEVERISKLEAVAVKYATYEGGCLR